MNPSVGTRVEVHGIAPGYKGVPKAVMVTPLVVAPAATDVPKAEQSRAQKKTPWPTFVREHPRWSDAAETCVPCARKAPRPELPGHPLFAPWPRRLLRARLRRLARRAALAELRRPRSTVTGFPWISIPPGWR
ncbi:hypothetical protein [Corallococcus sp. M7]